MIDFAALDAAKGLGPSAKNISRLAAIFGNEAASWAFHQWSLRENAKRKFSSADEMLFTQAGLEQASHEAVAAYHASRFPIGAKVVDLTCGIGGDLIAFSKRGPTVGFEIDAVTAEYAAYNAKEASVIVADCLESEWDFEYVFADPARRGAGGRTLNPDSFSPNPVVLAQRMRTLKFAGMKLSPMLADHYLEGISDCIEFVSFGWECREALAWFGTENEGIRAIKVETGEKFMGGGYAQGVDEPMEIIYEADPAAIRAHCLPQLCESLDALLLGDSNGYLTSATFTPCNWTKAYRVLDRGAFDIKRVRGLLKEFGGGAPEVKARAKVDVAVLRKRLTSDGSGAPTVLLYAVQKSVRFALVTPI